MAKRKRTENKSTLEQQTFLSRVASTEPERAFTYYLLTNRNNLLEILSSGWIKPAGWYSKYYNDLGQFCESFVPLLFGAPSSSFVDSLVDSDETAFPVLVTVDLSGLSGSISIINADFEVVPCSFPSRIDGICMLTQGVLPTSRINQVLFRSEEELREHKSRSYSNVPHLLDLYSVSPAHFSGPDMDPSLLVRRIQEAAATSLRRTESRVGTVDSISGILTMASTAIGRNKNHSLEHLIPLYEAILALLRSKPQSREVSDLATSYSYIPLLLEILWRGETVAHHQKEVSEREAADLVLLLETAKCLAEIDVNEFSAEGIREQVISLFQTGMDRLGHTESTEITKNYVEVISAIGDVGQGLLSLESLMANSILRESPILTALSMFLLKPEPHRVLTWVDEIFHYQPDAAVLAAGLSGALHGRARISLDCRPVASLQTFIDDLLGRLINQVTDGLQEPAIDDTLKVESSEIGELHSRQILMFGERVLIEKELVLSMVESLLDKLVSIDLLDEADRELAIRVCIEMGWHDCLVTEIVIQDRDFIIEHHSRKPHMIRINGLIQSEVSIVDRHFARRIDELNGDQFLKRLSPDVIKILMQR